MGGAGVVAILDYRLAVDYYVADALGELLWFGHGRGGGYCCRIEYHDVGFHAVAQQATIVDAQALRWETGHLADALFHTEAALLAHLVS